MKRFSVRTRKERRNCAALRNCFFSLSDATKSGVSKHEFDVKKHWNRLNKPAVKNIRRVTPLSKTRQVHRSTKWWLSASVLTSPLFTNVIYLAYQDNICVHSNRQFFVKCLIVGTVHLRKRRRRSLRLRHPCSPTKLRPEKTWSRPKEGLILTRTQGSLSKDVGSVPHQICSP
ncbi:hypothetical protein YC2023_012618 [Brassica napus]